MADTDVKPKEFLITGELVNLRDNRAQVQDLDVKVTYDTYLNEETGIEDLVSGKFSEGKFELRGTLEVPTDVTLSVLNEDDIIGVAKFVLCPKSKTKIEVRVGRDYPKVYLKGYVHCSTDPKRKFTFTGDLGKFGGHHTELTYVWIEGTTYELDGSRAYSTLGPVLLDNGKFSIESAIDEPTGVYVRIMDRNFSEPPLSSQTAIFEPGVNYEIGTIGNSEDIVILADREGVHSKLITDWQTDPVHLGLLEQQALAIEETGTTRNSKDGTNQELGSDKEDNEEPTDETVTATFADKYPPAVECKHVDLSSVRVDAGTDMPIPAWHEIENKIVDKRIKFLLPFMQNDEDLQLAWLAYILAPLNYSWMSPPFIWSFHLDGIALYGASMYELDLRELAILEELATKFSQKFVDDRITPKIEYILKRVSIYQNNNKVIAGQLAPPFTLSRVDGDSVSLHGVLKENELVLVNFWDKRCEPCIDSIPVLKEIYSAYHDEGFEIITVHLNRNKFSWTKSIDENETPGIDVFDSDDGELKGWEAPIETSYTPQGMGTHYETVSGPTTPNGFLIDQEGCIVQRDLTTEELESALASRWSEGSAE